MRRSRFLLGLLLCATLPACGKLVVTTDEAPDPTDAAPDGAFVNDPRCPAAFEFDGGACDFDAGPLECHYGSGSCMNLAICTLPGQIPNDLPAYKASTGNWITYPGPNDCAPNPSACPASFDSLPDNAECPATASEGLRCNYDEGICACAPNGTCGLSWECRPRSDVTEFDDLADHPGCPVDRPLEGTPCAPEGLACDYQSGKSYLSSSFFEPCTLNEFAFGPPMVCWNGTWTADSPFGGCGDGPFCDGGLP